MRSDGRPLRDYIYVEDAVDCTCLGQGVAGNPKLAGEAFNFSAGEPRSVLDVVDAIRRQMNSGLAPVILNEASNEILEQFLRSGKAHSMLGWRARFGFDGGLARSIAWYKEHLGAT